MKNLVGAESIPPSTQPTQLNNDVFARWLRSHMEGDSSKNVKGCISWFFFCLLLSSRLYKSEEDKTEINAMLDSVQKGLKINQTLTVRRKNDGS